MPFSGSSQKDVQAQVIPMQLFYPLHTFSHPEEHCPLSEPRLVNSLHTTTEPRAPREQSPAAEGHTFPQPVSRDPLGHANAASRTDTRPAPEGMSEVTASLFGLSSSGSIQEHFECLDCHKAYFTFSGLAKHRQLQCDWPCPKYFSCKYCDKEYSSLGALKMHIRTHTLPCVCKLCGKAFSRPWLLQGHIRTHTGEKPFSCSLCSRAFADRSNLRAHLQTHSDIKKYQCRNCSKTFSRISLLSKHEETGCCSTS
ncbi:zinc finger protein SNAI3 isoform X2 [Trichomycterus rosablanca]|uniref:zinc finger protein SNAI3 isoform X2 n=1 Tax=Trichomycterus rosablanca TaxID=2290929 RepID=UPI002F35434E